MASVSGLGSPQSGASRGFSGRLNVLYLIKGLPKPEKKGFPSGYGVKLHLWLEHISRWSRPPVQCSGAGQQGEQLGPVLWHPSSPLTPAGGKGTGPRGWLSGDASEHHTGRGAPAHAL